MYVLDIREYKFQFYIWCIIRENGLKLSQIYMNYTCMSAGPKTFVGVLGDQ